MIRPLGVMAMFTGTEKAIRDEKKMQERGDDCATTDSVDEQDSN